MRLTTSAGPCPESVLALDVSSTATGWAIVRRDLSLGEFGLIRPREKAPAIERVNLIVWEVRELLVRRGPCLAVAMEWCEGKSAGRIGKVSSLATLGQAQGRVYQAIRDSSRPLLPIHLIPENEWTGSVPKARRALKVAQLYPEYSAWSAADKGLDVADAIGLGIFFMGRAREAELIQRGSKRA